MPRTIVDATCRLAGCLIVDGELRLENTPTLEANLLLLYSPPLGYSTGTELGPIPSTWRWEAVD